MDKSDHDDKEYQHDLPFIGEKLSLMSLEKCSRSFR